MSEINVVQGEAPESDDDDHQTKAEKTKHRKSDAREIIYGSAVDGEAPESDDELKIPGISLINAEELNTPSSSLNEIDFFTSSYRYDSVLQRKLSESNSAFWQNLSRYTQAIVSSAVKQLMICDQLLLKSQVTLQVVSHSTKATNSSAKEVLEKIRNVATGNFIPAIKIPFQSRLLLQDPTFYSNI